MGVRRGGGRGGRQGDLFRKEREESGSGMYCTILYNTALYNPTPHITALHRTVTYLQLSLVPELSEPNGLHAPLLAGLTQLLGGEHVYALP